MKHVERIQPQRLPLLNPGNKPFMVDKVEKPAPRILGQSAGDAFGPRFSAASEISAKDSKSGVMSKTRMLFVLAISLLGVPHSLGHNNTAKDRPDETRDAIVYQASGEPMSTTIRFKAEGPLTQEHRKRYEAIESWFPYLEKNNLDWQTRNQGVAKVQGYWNDLRNEAVAGNAESRQMLHGLWVNRMYDELTRPSMTLVRFDYSHYGTLVNQKNGGQLTQAAFETEVQWRALEGLACYYGVGEKNDLTDDVQRFYEPVKNLLENNSDENIQRWGGYLMNTLFPKFTPVQQQQYLDKVGERFLQLKDGASKLTAMKGLSWLYSSSSGSDFWKAYTPKLHKALERTSQSKAPDEQLKQRYYIVLLSLLRDNGYTAAVEPILRPEGLDKDTQQSIVWGLGRVRSPKGLKLLTEVVENPKYDPVVQEMAMFSLAEYVKDYPQQVNQIIEDYAPPLKGAKNTPKKSNDTLQEAARAMREKLNDRSETEPDFYIKKLLKNEKDQKDYKRLRDQYVEGFDRLDVARKNMVDRSLLPYRQFLQDIINKGGKHKILLGDVTEASEYSKDYGTRISDGRLVENIHGMSSVNGAVTGKDQISPGGYNTFCHEFTHHLHQMVLNNQPGTMDKIVNLFKARKALDYYAAGNEYEYLAQGGEALDTPYKNHYLLYNTFFNDGFDSTGSHIRSHLKRKDEALYEFLKNLRSLPLEISMNLGEAERHQVQTELFRNIFKIQTQRDEHIVNRDQTIHVA
jgi:hypothetical protein